MTQLNSRGLRAVVEDADHVEEDGEHHEVRRPPMHVPHERAERHRRLDGLDVLVGAADRRHVEEHQVQPGDRQRRKRRS